ncbi:Methyltransferase domain [uncultured Roseburia sp.]|uniref:Class I SAM-dependent methyltransferase n=1 Tax=Brotonthovivens ammoniilytica TaxID=2981725 RepID=A0ABT2TM47_9FIRM|nr:class I SAM-dependent methyltransferase [Brotonthovivens ammoniilytica]MCU6763293.1 class I SAM-dependent methyltransferase [Brotonthovivens ammoniilytica]SCJ12286.1 Methyltransferase domain [uncultured Roseburia sp.]
MFKWTKESIEWYQRAAFYTQYHVNLRKTLLPFFSQNETVCDIGCGLGYLDLELAPFVKAITAVDREKKVTDLLSAKVSERKLTNLTVRCADWSVLTDECCDTLLMCAFGNVHTYLEKYLGICKKRIIIIRKSPKEIDGGFSSVYNRKRVMEQDVEFVKQCGLNTQLKFFDMEFGQPLTSRWEAERFVLHYSLKPDHITMSQYLKTHLKELPGGKYPYYLPNKKEMYMFTIEKESAR